MLALTAAMFDTEMTNARITDPLNPTLQTLAGTETVNGFEFGAQGRITDNWEIIAGYTYLDPTAIGLVAAGIHGPIPNTAHNQANLWTTYDFDFGLKIGAGVELYRHAPRRHGQSRPCRAPSSRRNGAGLYDVGCDGRLSAQRHVRPAAERLQPRPTNTTS